MENENLEVNNPEEENEEPLFRDKIFDNDFENTELDTTEKFSIDSNFVEKTFDEPNAEPEYYIYYQFTSKDTSKTGRFEGQFMLRNSDGVLITPTREKLYINIQDSFIADDLEFTSCYVSDFPCCVNPVNPTPTPTNIPSNDLTDIAIPNNDIISYNIPDNNLDDDIIPNNDIRLEILL
jgi:hypothetical protein